MFSYNKYALRKREPHGRRTEGNADLNINRTGFNGTAPLPKEANNAVENAKRLPKTVEY